MSGTTKRSIFFVAIIVSSFVIVFFLDEKEFVEQPILFSEVQAGSYYTYSSERYAGVVNSREEFLALGFTRKDIDFSDTTILFVSFGEKNTGGYTIEIESIVDVGGRIHVQVVRMSPGPGCMVTQAFTHPFSLVATEKFTKDVVFLFSDVVREC